MSIYNNNNLLKYVVTDDKDTEYIRGNSVSMLYYRKNIAELFDLVSFAGPITNDKITDLCNKERTHMNLFVASKLKDQLENNCSEILKNVRILYRMTEEMDSNFNKLLLKVQDPDLYKDSKKSNNSCLVITDLYTIYTIVEKTSEDNRYATLSVDEYNYIKLSEEDVPYILLDMLIRNLLVESKPIDRFVLNMIFSKYNGVKEEDIIAKNNSKVNDDEYDLYSAVRKILPYTSGSDDNLLLADTFALPIISSSEYYDSKQLFDVIVSECDLDTTNYIIGEVITPSFMIKVPGFEQFMEVLDLGVIYSKDMRFKSQPLFIFTASLREWRNWAPKFIEGTRLSRFLFQYSYKMY